MSDILQVRKQMERVVDSEELGLTHTLHAHDRLMLQQRLETIVRPDEALGKVKVHPVKRLVLH